MNLLKIYFTQNCMQILNVFQNFSKILPNIYLKLYVKFTSILHN